VLTRPVIINPKQHWQGIGKSTDKQVPVQPEQAREAQKD